MTNAQELLVGSLLIAVCAFTAAAQRCPHPSNIELTDHVRVLPPIELKITHYDGKLLEYVVQDERETRVGSLSINSKSLIEADFSREYKKKKWWIVYCQLHRTVYSIYFFDQGKLRTSPS